MFFLLFCDFCYWQDWSVGLIISVINHSYYKPNFTNLYNTALLSSTLCPKKTSPTFLSVTWKQIIRFWLFLAWISLTQLAIKWPFSFPPHLTIVSALPGENATSKISLFYPMRYDCLISITRKNTFCSHFWHCGWHFIQLSIFQLPAVKLLEALAHYVNTCKQTFSPFIDSSIDNVLLQTNPGTTSRFLISQTFLNFIW